MGPEGLDKRGEIRLDHSNAGFSGIGRERSQEKKDQYFLSLAKIVALHSGDKNTKVGTVIVNQNAQILAIGFNDLPEGVSDTPERRKRPAKYQWTEHAERNAIYQAAQRGIPLLGGHLYMNYSPAPCIDCTRAIIQAGITRIILPDTPFPSSEEWHFAIALEMIRETGIELVILS